MLIYVYTYIHILYINKCVCVCIAGMDLCGYKDIHRRRILSQRLLQPEIARSLRSAQCRRHGDSPRAPCVFVCVCVCVCVCV